MPNEWVEFDGETFLMRAFGASVMYRLPAASFAMSTGPANCAAAASPPSPLKPDAPAMDVIMPTGDTIRIRWLAESAIYKFPWASRKSPPGAHNCAEVAGPPSPFGAPAVLQTEELSATVLIRPSAVTWRTR